MAGAKNKFYVIHSALSQTLGCPIPGEARHFDDFFLAFPEYEKYEDDLDVGECESIKEKRQRRSKIIEILTEKLCMMVDEGNSFRFLHQNFRDYLFKDVPLRIFILTAICLKKKNC